MSKYPQFAEALRQLGSNNEERAKRIGVSARSVAYYLRGDHLPSAEVIKREPSLDAALTRDLQSQNHQELAHIPA